MRLQDLPELQYIAHFDNVISICQIGLLSHQRADSLPHRSVAMEALQERRRRKTVPGGRPLHQYVNIYFCARNPMLYIRKGLHAELCVLRISTQVLDLPDVAITDQNAASGYARFYLSPAGLEHVDYELVFAEYWTHPNQIEEWRHSSIKCAEVLAPDRVAPEYILGAYVSNGASQLSLQEQLRLAGIALEVTVDGHLFFL